MSQGAPRNAASAQERQARSDFSITTLFADQHRRSASPVLYTVWKIPIFR